MIEDLNGMCTSEYFRMKKTPLVITSRPLGEFLVWRGMLLVQVLCLLCPMEKATRTSLRETQRRENVVVLQRRECHGQTSILLMFFAPKQDMKRRVESLTGETRSGDVYRMQSSS